MNREGKQGRAGFYLDQLKEGVFQLLYPRVCPVCEEILTEKLKAEENPYICKYCLQHLLYVEEPYCMQCGRPLPDPETEFCTRCQSSHQYFDRGIALLVHDDNARKMLYDLKYDSRQDNADFFGQEAARMAGRRVLAWKPDVLIPVPLHKKRQFARGFNQAELLAEKFMQALMEIYGTTIPLDTESLLRRGKTIPQKELDDRQRAANVSGKFCLAADRLPADGNGSPAKRILLLDDICTSGATLNECAKVLKQAGAEKVFYLTMSIVGE